MNTPIIAFLVIGALFGLATYSNRHLFSEGAARPGGKDEQRGLDGRLVWVAICTMLWPILALTGVYGAVRQRAKVRQLHQGQQRPDRRR